MKRGPKSNSEEVFHRDTNKFGPIHPVLKTRCWIWTRGPLSKKCLYGQISVNHKSVRVHRYAWQLYHGPIPNGLSVCHKCDNPLCVNPEHLFVGTEADNKADMVSKMRQAYGERGPATRLTEKQALEIKRRYKKVSRGHGNGAQLAREFGISKTAVQYIAQGRNWKYL